MNQLVLIATTHLPAYVDGAGLQDDPMGPLFRVIDWGADLTATYLSR